MLATCFNSIKVRLRRRSLQAPWLSTSFQFHKGTIKTPQRQYTYRLSIMFQFHKGTIKTLRLHLLRFYNLRFNSIKVRLRPRWYYKHLGLSLFQFHKGTIKTNPDFPFYGVLDKFQFHKGTIKTICSWVLFAICASFNSIKVRLRQLKHIRSMLYMLVSIP